MTEIHVPERHVLTAADSISGALLDCVDDAILVLGPGLDIRYANHAATAITAAPDGTPSDLGGIATRLVHPDDVTTAIEALERTLAGRRTKARLRLQLATGELPVEELLRSVPFRLAFDRGAIEAPGVDRDDLRRALDLGALDGGRSIALYLYEVP